MEETKVAESILYSVNLQLDIGNTRGSTYGLQVWEKKEKYREKFFSLFLHCYKYIFNINSQSHHIQIFLL